MLAKILIFKHSKIFNGSNLVMKKSVAKLIIECLVSIFWEN